MLYPLTFHPIYKERIWGGRNLVRLYQKNLPPGPIGESWEITDRPEGVSVIANGPLAGKDLRWLMEKHPEDLLGPMNSLPARFPLLIKILDAQEILSLQVHPPANLAWRLGGEPKTELWYITQATTGAELFVGLKQGITKADFERRIRDGSLTECVHRIAVRAGDAMFLPSGRVHAIGAGNVIFEIQQNSDTTYRVFDWNRVDGRGKPRALHIDESLQSIDFADYEPGLVAGSFSGGAINRRTLVEDPLFFVEEVCALAGAVALLKHTRAVILGVISGLLSVITPSAEIALEAGRFCLIPASLGEVNLRAGTACQYLQAVPA